MMLFKLCLLTIFSLTMFAGNVSAFGWKLSDVKRGANSPLHDFELSHLVKMLVKRKKLQETMVISKKIQNQNAYEMRKILKLLRLGTMDKKIEPYHQKLKQRQKNRFHSYRRFHTSKN